MRRVLLIVAIALVSVYSYAQEVEDSNNETVNTAEKMLNQQDKKLMIGGYGQIDYNQNIDSDVRNNGTLDVHRMVMMFGYNFNDRVQFISEVEYEHVKEVYIEQAFINYKINDFINFRGGLLLVPMGIINEYHEPVSFNGVERPNLDKYIVPSTWREIGAGVSGRFTDASIKYQLYVMNGFNGYDGSAKFNGKKGLRSGRQKGAESFMSSPNFAGRVDYYGISGLTVGLSGYMGESQSVLYDGLDKNDDTALQSADSSVVGLSMVGVDARFNKNGIQLRGQVNYATLSNTQAYNEFTGSDVGSSLFGYYAEVGYNVLNNTDFDTELTPFVRYEQYNTHNSVDGGLEADDAYNRTEITMGLGYKIAKGAVLKFDYQMVKTGADDEYSNRINAGVGVWF